MLATLRPAFTLLVVLAAITGLAYPALIGGIAAVAFPESADGSLVRDGEVVVGSALIAQDFVGPGYLHPRPSAAGKGFDAANSGATNFAPGAKDLHDAVAVRIDGLRREGIQGAVPSDLVTTSASGLDPDLSPAAALAQAPRIAAARHIPVGTVTGQIEQSIRRPLFGFIGEPHVNVLLLNRQLDRIAPKPAA